MLFDVLTGFYSVSGVDANGHDVREASSHEGDVPFRSVKAYNIYSCSLGNALGNQRSGKGPTVLVVLCVGPVHPLATALHRKRVLFAHFCLGLKQIVMGCDWSLAAYTSLCKIDGDFVGEALPPVDKLAVASALF